MNPKSCSIDGCSSPTFGHGWCQRHYARWRRHGDPLATPRFDPWSKIHKLSADECWPWTKSCDRDGYGVTKIGGQQWRVARWVLSQKLGRALAEDELARHTCDNPPCCNPGHLVVGTWAENSADQVERDRTTRGDRHYTRRDPHARRRGEANGSARLNADQVIDIRSQYAGGATQAQLAAAFGISQPLVSQIVRRVVWTHIE